MHILPPKPICFLAMALLFTGFAFGKQEFKASNLAVKVVVEPHPRTVEDYRLTFTIINFGKDSIPYESSLETHGLDFHLYDHSGNEIAPEKDWFAYNSPRNPNIVSGHFSKLNPGQSLKYVLSFGQAFASRWRSAKRIRVDWMPTSHPGAPPVLTGSYNLEALFDGSGDVDHSLSEDSQRLTLTSSGMTTEPVSKKESQSNVRSPVLSAENVEPPIVEDRERESPAPWSLLALVFALAGVLLLVFFNRRQ